MASNPSKEKIIDGKYLDEHPNHIFVFGDNNIRKGHGGAAILRSYPNTYGFITKKAPTHYPADYYKPEEYNEVFKKELLKLMLEIYENPNKVYMISRLGAGLADKYGIYEAIIKDRIQVLKKFDNVVFLYED